MNPIIISGSARNDGDTEALVEKIIDFSAWKALNLNNYRFSQYDYLHNNRKDDFLPLMKKVLDQHDMIIFVTPVYWYSMSGVLKMFFDRLTDLITIEKDEGRKMRGMKMAVITTSNGNNLGDDFWLPFRKSAEYLGMEFLDGLHTYDIEKDDLVIERFLENIAKEKKLLQ